MTQKKATQKKQYNEKFETSLEGNLTRDAELRYTTNGKAVCSFTVAVNDSTGHVNFVNVEAWESRAENIADSLSKGKSVSVDGRIRITRQKSEKNGTMYTNVALVANRVRGVAIFAKSN